MSDIFLDLEGNVIEKSNMLDEHEIIKIIEKTPIIDEKKIGKFVCGDVNSHILTFEMNRYYDGVDLITKNIKYIVKIENEDLFAENSVNMQYNDNLIRFSWIPSGEVTKKKGKVSVGIIFLGQEEGKNYSLKIIPFNITIEDSLMFLNVEPSYKNWFLDIEIKIMELQSKINENIGKLTFETEPIDFLAEWNL